VLFTVYRAAFTTKYFADQMNVMSSELVSLRYYYIYQSRSSLDFNYDELQFSRPAKFWLYLTWAHAYSAILRISYFRWELAVDFDVYVYLAREVITSHFAI